MKKFSEIVKESNERIKIKLKKTPVNYLSPDELRKYLEIANNFLSEPAKEVCNWLIDNNEYYQKNINSLVDFFNSGLPEKKELRKLYSNINKVNDTGRVKEIPVFMTRTEFENVIDKKIPADKAIMDFETEEGRNEIARRYIPLVHKIVNSWVGKTALSRDELFEAGMHGLADAMKDYGEKSSKAKRTNKDVNLDKYMAYTFLQIAAQRIRIVILETIKDESHLVRIPRSKQAEEKEKNGFNVRSNSVSGDSPMGGKDGSTGKTLFDLVGAIENPGKEMDRREINSLWDEILSELEEKFGPKTMDIFKNHFGFGLESGQKKLSGKEMAAKYGYSSPSSITSEITKVINFIKKDKDMYQKFVDISELMAEAKHDEDEDANDNEPIYVSSKIMEQKMYGINNNDSWD